MVLLQGPLTVFKMRVVDWLCSPPQHRMKEQKLIQHGPRLETRYFGSLNRRQRSAVRWLRWLCPFGPVTGYDRLIAVSFPVRGWLEPSAPAGEFRFAPMRGNACLDREA